MPGLVWVSADLGVLRREGWPVNRKRVRRLCRLDGLRVRRRKPMALHRGSAPTPVGPQERWSMDFVHDTLAEGRPFRILTVVDNGRRCHPVLEAGCRMSGETVSQVLDRVLGEGQSLRSITVDHGTEFHSRALDKWAYRRGVQLASCSPANRWKTPESCNGRLRDECVNVHQFVSLAEAQPLSKPGGATIISVAPHRSLAHLTPNEFVAQRQGQQIVEEALCSD